LEKNVVSEPKYRNSGNLKYSGNSRNAPLRLKIFGLFVNGEIKMRASLADGEELGSNLLHVHANVTESNLVQYPARPQADAAIALLSSANNDLA
jgi:hypothetical protein